MWDLALLTRASYQVSGLMECTASSVSSLTLVRLRVEWLTFHIEIFMFSRRHLSGITALLAQPLLFRRTTPPRSSLSWS